MAMAVPSAVTIAALNSTILFIFFLRFLQKV